MALLDKEDTASTSGLDERGDLLAILDQIQWQCPTCHIILGGTHNSCTKPDCKGTKYTALKELLVLLGRLFVSGVEEECDSPNVITLADYVNTLLDAHGQARSGLVASSWHLDRAGHSCCCIDPSEQGGSEATIVNPDGDNHTGVLPASSVPPCTTTLSLMRLS